MEESQLSKLILDQSKNLFWVTNLNFQLIYANKSYLSLMKKLTGFEMKLNESALITNFGKDHFERWKTYYDRALSGEFFEIEEHFYQPESNEIQYTHVTFEPITGDHDNIFAVSCHSKEVTHIVKHRSKENQMIDASLDVFCTINEKGNFVYVSAAVFTNWGYLPEELLGKPFMDFVVEDDVIKTSEAAAAILSGKEVKSFINRYKKKEGGLAYNIWSVRWDESAKLMYCVARDGKEKIEQDEKIIESELRFKALVQEGSDIISILDTKGNYIYTSPTITSILGISLEKFMGRNAFEFIHPDDIERTTACLQKIAFEKRVIVEPFRFQNDKKEWRWMETVLTNMLDNPAVKGIVANSRDITEKIEERHKLKLFESVITNTSDSVLITEAEPFDEPGPRIIYVNEAFTKMTGYTAAEVIGKTPRILKGPNSNKEELAKLSKAIKNWESHEITTINYKKNGEEFWVNFTVTPVADEKGVFTHWIATHRDISELKSKELENELLAKISIDFNSKNDLIAATNGLCKSISKFGNFDWVEVWTTNVEKSQMQLISHYVVAPEDEKFYDFSRDIDTFQLSEGLAGNVWYNETKLLWNDIENHKDFVRRNAAKKIGLKAVLGIPLLFNNEVVGVLKIGTKKNGNHLKKYSQLFHQLESYVGSEINRKKLENDLSHLFDAIPDILCLLDFEGRFLKINNAGCKLLGYKEEEILYHSFDKFIHPADKDIAFSEVLGSEQGENTTKFENRYISKSGEIIWLNWLCNTALEDGIIYATAKNITEEKKLRELNRQAGIMSKIGSWEVDLINSTAYWSEMTHQIHETDSNSYSPNLKDGLNFFREDFQPMINSLIERSITTGESFDLEAVLVTANKNERWIRAIGNTEIVDGKCQRIYGSFQDIHERKEAEERLQSLSDNIPGVVFQYLLYPDGTDALKYVSKGSEKIWGFSPEAITKNVDLVWNQTKAGGDFEAVQQSIKDSIENKSNWSIRYRTVSPTGEFRVLQGLGKPDFLADGTVVYNSVVLDITQEVKNEELLVLATNLAKIGSWEIDLVGNKIFWSDKVHELHETDPKSFVPNLEIGINFYREDFRQMIQLCIENSIATGELFDFEAVLVTANKKEVWVRSIGNTEFIDGECKRIYGSFQDIDERKKSAIKLVESENRLRTILDAEPECVKLLDSTGEVLMMNPAGLAMIEAENEEQVIGKSVLGIVMPEHRSAFSKLTKNVFKDEPGKLEFEIQGFKGKRRWLETHAVPLKNEQGKIISLLGVTRDITDRKKAEEAITDSEEKRRLIMNGALDAIICIDTNEMITFWNPQAEIIFGWKEAEVIGQSLSELIVPEPFRKYHVEGLKNYLKTGEGKAINVLLELSAINRSGQEFPIELTVIPIKQGGEEFFCAFIRDITQRKKAEESILKSNERFEKVSQATSDAIWDWNIVENSQYWGDGFLHLFGYDVNAAPPTANSWQKYVHPDDFDRVNDSLNQALESTADSWVEEYRYEKSDGSCATVIDRGIILRDSNQKPVRMIGAMSDISNLKKQEEQLIILNKSLEHHTKELERSNEELEQFAFVASHDLQEPLRMISSFMDLLQKKYGEKLDDKGHQYINFATDGAKRMKQIILDLLDYSRATKSTDSKQEVNFNEVLSEFKHLRRKIILEKAVVIKAPQLPVLSTYKVAVTQILHCLLDNAIKYTHKGDAPVIAINVVERLNEWEFSIKDNGIGIDSQYHDKIFIIFQRLHNKEEYAGTGIGLSIAKRHVEFLGGQIWLASVPGEGTVFYFTIPKTK